MTAIALMLGQRGRAATVRRLFKFLAGLVLILLLIFVGLASYYWVGWPYGLRLSIGIVLCPLLAGLWFVFGRRRSVRRLIVTAFICVFFAVYILKSPAPQAFVPLHAKLADVTWIGSVFEIENYRDAVYQIGAPADPVWTTHRFDLDDLTGAQFILQPFGNSLATVHVMTSFTFRNGDHLAVSFEARRTSWDNFDPLAGFFRHDQLYAVLGTERDLLWKRLSHVPPNDLYIFELTAPPVEIRAYLRRLLNFVASIHDRPQFYSTISESCFTTLLKLSPGIEKTVPWYDLRRWVPGASVGLFQELGLIDDTVSADTLIRRSKLRSGIRPPWEFNDAASWSQYIRSDGNFAE